MPSRRFLLIATSVVLLASLSLVARATQTAESAAAPVKLRLTLLLERRERQVIPSDDAPGMFDRPGLVCTFAAELPKGLTMFDVEVAGEVVARDAAGTDLADVEPGFFGQPEYLKLVQDWGGPPTEFTVTLAQSARQAATFDLRVPLQITAFAGTSDHSIDLNATRLSVGEEIFGGVKATVELQRDTNSYNITFRPGTVHDLIDSIEIHGTEVVEAGMTMSNDDSVTYQFDDVKGDYLKLNFTVRTNFQRLPTVIEVKGIALP